MLRRIILYHLIEEDQTLWRRRSLLPIRLHYLKLCKFFCIFVINMCGYFYCFIQISAKSFEFWKRPWNTCYKWLDQAKLSGRHNAYDSFSLVFLKTTNAWSVTRNMAQSTCTDVTSVIIDVMEDRRFVIRFARLKNNTIVSSVNFKKCSKNYFTYTFFSYN